MGLMVHIVGFVGMRNSDMKRIVKYQTGFYGCVGIGGMMLVDFGVALADVAGSEQTIHFLVATLPHSNLRYAVAMPSANAQCLCTALSLVFEHMGGVPSTIVMDNATRAPLDLS